MTNKLLISGSDENVFVETLLDGISKAADIYFQWSRGFSITDRGTEHVMNVIVAQELYIRYNQKIGIVLEENYDGISYKAQTAGIEKIRGRPEGVIRKRGRIDIAIYDEEDRPYAVIEGKRGNAPSYSNADIQRIAAYIKRFGQPRGGSLKRGAFISLGYSLAAKFDKLRSDMDERAKLFESKLSQNLQVTAHVRAIDRAHKNARGEESSYAAVVFMVKE